MYQNSGPPEFSVTCENGGLFSYEVSKRNKDCTRNGTTGPFLHCFKGSAVTVNEVKSNELIYLAEENLEENSIPAMAWFLPRTLRFRAK